MAIWKDFDINLGKARNGDIKTMYEVDAIKNSLINIMSTMQGQRRMLNEFALPIYGLLFEPMDKQTANSLGSAMLSAIDKWEDRIKVEHLKIIANYEDQTYDVTLTFSVNSTGDTEQFTYVLKKL